MILVLAAKITSANGQTYKDSLGNAVYLNSKKNNAAKIRTIVFNSWSTVDTAWAKIKFVNLKNLETSQFKIDKFLTTQPELPYLKSVKFDLSYKDSIPDKIWNYTSIETLIITQAASINIPEKINGLVNLRELIIKGNFDMNSFPLNNKRLPDLKVLEFSGRKKSCKFNLSSEIFKFNNLEELSLNSGWGNFPMEGISNLRNLKKLILRSNEINDFHEDLFSLQNLTELDLSGNINVKSLSKEIGRLSNLKILNLEWLCKIKRLPEELAGLINLEALNLNKCKILKGLPEKIGDLKMLKDINMNGCDKLMKLPESFGKLSEIKNLKLCLTGKKLPATFGELKNLNTIDLRECRNLDGDEAIKILSECKGLKNIYMSFSDKKLPVYFKNMMNLRSANLSFKNDNFDWKSMSAICNDSLSELSVVSDKINLQELFMAISGSSVKRLALGNKIIAVPPEIELMQGLEELDLSENKISFIHENIGRLTNLRFLNLDGQITQNRNKEPTFHLKEIPTSLAKLTRLKELYLFDAKIPGDFIRRLKTKLKNCEIGCDVD